MKQPLTDRQREFYEYVKDYAAEHGKFPTYAQMCEDMNFSSANSVTQFLFHLENKGYIRKGPYGWELVPNDCCLYCGHALEVEEVAL